MIKALSARSIASRLFLSAAFWSTLILALAGLGLSALNKQWSEANFDDQLGIYLKALVAYVAVPSEEGKAGAQAAIAPQFELAFSGWYWQITRTDVNPPEIRASKSLFATQLPQLVAVGNDHGAILSGYTVGPGGASAQDDPARDRRRRRRTIPGAGRRQRRRDPGSGAQLRNCAGSNILDLGDGVDRLDCACGSFRPAPAERPPGRRGRDPPQRG
jgi:hypothetical protein